MRNLMWVLAGSAIILAGCGDKEQTEIMEQVEQSVQQESAGMVADVVPETPSEPVDPIVLQEVESVEMAKIAGAEAMESAGDTLDAAEGDVSESATAAAGAAGAMLVEETPADIPVPADAGTVDTNAAAQDATATVDLEQGKNIYTGKCFACHATGVAGAPKLGDAANWTPRIAQGMDVMTANAINGFKGATGFMPAKGGYATLTDEEVTAAVAYMANEGR